MLDHCADSIGGLPGLGASAKRAYVSTFLVNDGGTATYTFVAPADGDYTFFVFSGGRMPGNQEGFSYTYGASGSLAVRTALLAKGTSIPVQVGRGASPEGNPGSSSVILPGNIQVVANPATSNYESGRGQATGGDFNYPSNFVAGTGNVLDFDQRRAASAPSHLAVQGGIGGLRYYPNGGGNVRSGQTGKTPGGGGGVGVRVGTDGNFQYQTGAEGHGGDGMVLVIGVGDP